VRALVARHRRYLALLGRERQTLQTYARLVLRAFLQGLSVVAPEVALAALALEDRRKLLRPARLDELARLDPPRAETQKILHDLEPTLAQLGHREAHEMLAILLDERHPLLGED
jgi:hypothetical protein